MNKDRDCVARDNSKIMMMLITLISGDSDDGDDDANADGNIIISHYRYWLYYYGKFSDVHGYDHGGDICNEDN
jgi:hypothetical protein